MAEDKEMTHVEHYVPKLYFRQFSESGKSLYRYKTTNLDKGPELRSIDRICRDIDMYELLDENKDYIAPNRIEHIFGRLETEVGRVIKSIKVKSQNENCQKCPAVLSNNDKSYLIIFITSLLFRDPKTIELGIRNLQEANPSIDTREARNFTLLNLLPLGIDQDWDNNTIIRTAIERLCGMAFQIGLADNDEIITSDRPVVLWPPNENDPYDRPRAVVLPLTSRIVIYLYPMENVDPIGRNCFIKLSDEQIRDIQYNVSIYARDWIFTRNQLNSKQLEVIKEARRSMEDEKNKDRSH